MIALSGIGIASAFAAGVISFVSPCVLPLVPGYISFMAGQSLEDVERQIVSRERLGILVVALCFVVGFSAVFVSLGAGASYVGALLARYRYETNIAGGVIVIVFGLFMLGLLRLNWLHREWRFHGNVPGNRAVAALLLGIAFAFGWTPCVGPILGAILTVSATSGGAGTSLLAIYSVGLGVPFVVAALFTDWSLRHLRAVRRVGPMLHKGAGVLLIVMGAAMVTGYLDSVGQWLLHSVPVLGKLG